MVVDTDAARRRRDVLSRLGVIDRIGDPALTGLTRIASYITGASSAAIHIIDEEYQRRIAAVNAPLGDHAVGDSMCRLVVEGDEGIVVEDASDDPRFAHSSFVTGPDPVRFYASLPLRTADTTVVGTLCAFDTDAKSIDEDQIGMLEDLATQAIAQIELTRLAIDLGHAASHDPLTGAVNRLLLADRLERAIARRRRHGGEVLVAVFDLDGFKAINDTHGHAAGDGVLVTLAQRLVGSARAEDTVARIGGDEFALVAEVDDAEAATELVNRLELALRTPISVAGRPRRLRITTGAALAEPGDDPGRVIARADRAMYERKPPG
jgi:diguanylate cyclase (GGDEF)-like protein